MKQKIILCLALTLFATASAYSLDISGMLGSNNLFDLMFAQMLVRFYQMKYTFISIMQTISVGIAIIGAFWWVMKIVIMGESTEKAIVDILTKIILYIVLVMLYPKIVDGCLSLATKIGMSNGIEELNIKFAEMANEIQIQMNAAQLAANKGYLDDLASKAKKKTKEIDEAVLNEYAKENDLDSYQLKIWLDGYGYGTYKTVTYSYETNQMYQGEKISFQATKKVSQPLNYYVQKYNENTRKIAGLLKQSNTSTSNDDMVSDAVAKAFNMFAGSNKVENPEYYEKMEQTLITAIKGKRNSLKHAATGGMSQKDAKNRIVALARVCMEEDEVETFEKELETARRNMHAVSIDKVMRLQPFMPLDADHAETGALGDGNLVLSPSAMLKIALLCASLASSNTEEAINSEVTGVLSTDENGEEKKGVTGALKSVAEWVFTEVMSFVINLIIVFGIIMCAVYFCIQYIMMICEYYLVAAICYILLPLLMWEVTASYTKNLMKLAFSYFFKTMVMLLVLMWAYGCFLDLANYLTVVGISNMIATLMNVIFTLLITMSFVGEAPKIAQVILTGNPDMSMGEFMKQVGVAAGAAKLGGKLAKKAGGAAAKTAALPVKGGVMAKQMSDAHKEKKGEVSAAKEMQGKAEGELGTAKENLSSAKDMQEKKAGAVTAAKQEQAAAKQNVAATEKEFNAADKQVAKSQKAYDEAKKNAEGKAEGSKEKLAMQAAASQLLVDQNKRQEARQRMDEAKSNLKQKNTNVKSAQTGKNNADKAVEEAQKTVKEKEQFVKDATANVKRAQKMPGARGYVGALMLDGINHSKPVTHAFGGQGAREWAEQKRKTGDAAREKKLNKLSDKMNGEG